MSRRHYLRYIAEGAWRRYELIPGYLVPGIPFCTVAAINARDHPQYAVGPPR